MPAKIDLQRLGARIREAREKAGLSQERLAEVVGITAEAMGRIERGKAEPSLGTALGIAESLGLDFRGGGRRSAAAGRGSASPLAKRIGSIAAGLDPEDQAALLRLIQRLPTREER